MPSNNRQEKMKALSEKLEQGVRDIYENGFSDYLHFVSGFHHYSTRNTQLILAQKPDATMVAGFSKWKEMGRSVNKGEHGILIMAPMPTKHVLEETHDKHGNLYLDSDGKPVPRKKEITETYFAPVYVFDISQTSGREVPLNNATLEYSELTGEVKDYERFFEGVKRAAPLPIRFDESGEAEGYTDFKNQEIVLQSGKSQSQNLTVAFHEMAHAALHNPANAAETKSKKAEVEAEGVAFVLSEYFGISTGSNSFSYIAEWSASQELDVLKDSLITIQRTASDLIDDIEKQYKEICKEQPQQSQDTITPEQAAQQLIDSYEMPNTPEHRKVFGEQEKAAIITYAKHQPDFDKVAQLAANMSVERFERGHGYIDPAVDREVKLISCPIKIDTPFVPTLEVTSDKINDNGDMSFEVWDHTNNVSFTIEESDRKDFHEINAIDLDTGESFIVGFSTARSYNFELDDYEDTIFWSGVALGPSTPYFSHLPGSWRTRSVSPNIHFGDRPGRWHIDSTLDFRGQTYYLARNMNKQKPEYILADQSKSILREHVFSDKQFWDKRDFIDLVANILAEQAIEKANGTAKPALPSPPPSTPYYVFQAKESITKDQAQTLSSDCYECVYYNRVNPNESLNDIYSKLQISDLPPDYGGKPMSPGDIIVLNSDWFSAFQVQETGIVPCPEFLDNFRGKIDCLAPNGTVVETEYYTNYQEFRLVADELHNIGRPIREQHMSIADYDREVNQLNENPQLMEEEGEPAGPTVAALEADVKAGKTISLVDLANAVKAEPKSPKRGRRTSLSEKVSRAKIQSEKQMKPEPSKAEPKKNKDMEL